MPEGPDRLTESSLEGPDLTESIPPEGAEVMPDEGPDLTESTPPEGAEVTESCPEGPACTVPFFIMPAERPDFR